MFKNLNKSSGQVSRLLLILAIVIFVAIIIVFIVLKITERPSLPPTPPPDEVKPIYETVINDIRFVFIDAIDMGKTLKGTESRYPDWQKDVSTTERFIKITIGAQNKGKENVPERVWDIFNIIDSEGRNYVPVEYKVDSWLPDSKLCAALLKPEFNPIPCIKIYEVSKVSTGLKIQVATGKKKSESEYSFDERDRVIGLLDLIVTPK